MGWCCGVGGGCRRGRRSGLRRQVVGAVIALGSALRGRLFKGHVAAGAGPARVLVGAADVSPADGLLRDALGAGDGLVAPCSGWASTLLTTRGGVLWQLLVQTTSAARAGGGAARGRWRGQP